jgi:hypothetical protein
LRIYTSERLLSSTRIANSAVARHGAIGIIYRYMIVGSAPPMLHLIVHFVIAFQLACVGSRAKALGNTVIEDGAERNVSSSGELSLLPSGARRTEPAGLLGGI